MGPKSNAKRSTAANVATTSSTKKKGGKGTEDVVVTESPQKAVEMETEVVPSAVEETPTAPSSSSASYKKHTVHDIVSDSITELAQELWAGSQGSVSIEVQFNTHEKQIL